VEAIASHAGWKPGDPEPPRMREARDAFGRALRCGVTIACGSDAGVFRHGANARELELMVDHGMTAAQALRAATSTAASVLGRAGALGVIAEESLADLVAVRADPLRDIRALRGPLVVIKGGVPARGPAAAP
jgi:imidazolonepropionase-like amidohydrolase